MEELLFDLHSQQRGRSKEELLAQMDSELEKFSRYMDTLDSPGRGALSNPEKALVKTFMVFVAKRAS